MCMFNDRSTVLLRDLQFRVLSLGLRRKCPFTLLVPFSFGVLLSWSFAGQGRIVSTIVSNNDSSQQSALQIYSLLSPSCRKRTRITRPL